MNIRYMQLILALVAICLPSHASESGRDAAFQQSLQKLFDAHRGQVGAAVQLLPDGEVFTWNADQTMPTASLIKLPLMVTAYKLADAGKLSLDEHVTLREQDKTPGSGLLSAHFSEGASISLRDAIRLMIAYSDNTATNLVIDQTGLEATNTMTSEQGYPETRLHSKVYGRSKSIDPERSKLYGLGSTSASETVAMLADLHAGKLASSGSTSAMYEHLRNCTDDQMALRYLPDGVSVAHKTGAVSAARTDAGIIESPAGPIVYCILTAENADRRWAEDNEAELLTAEFGRMVYEHFNSDAPAAVVPAARVLSLGDDGALVADLQRTINARIVPSPDIGVDGDFGPNTEAAVKAFQQQADLEPSGRVDSSTWRALGTLVTSDVPLPSITEVNQQTLEKSPPDALDGPPVVSAKAYAIADAETGALLFGMNENAKRDPASTTKIMTAHLVISYLEQHSDLLDDTITFSTSADATPGSSCQLRAGETLPVRELLYGLMLPSGNDASVMLGEWFGSKIVGDSKADSYGCFIDAMNTEAQRLGMDNTTYKNTSGLTAEGHQSTAADLVKLAHTAMQNPLFQEIVKTRRHGVTVDSLTGYRRDVVWKNTNRLLGIEGFDGVKTGTTGPAGACLVSRGESGGRRFFIVVLGSTSSDSRYVDSRNLYRWAGRLGDQIEGVTNATQ